MIFHPQVVCALDAALDASGGHSQRSSCDSSLPESTSRSPSSKDSPSQAICTSELSFTKIEALHGSYLAIALPSSAGQYHSISCSPDSKTLHQGGADSASIRLGAHSLGVRPSDGLAPAPPIEEEVRSATAVAGVDNVTCGHAEAAAAAALLMARQAGEIELPGGGRTRVRVGLCSGAVCCAVIGEDRPRFR